MLGRRAFLISSGSLVAGAAAAKAGVPETLPAVVVSRVPVAAAKPAVALSIYGWDNPSDLDDGAAGQIWISVGNSWRTAWR